MIEVEKKFRPTEEQLKALLEGAEFLGEKNLDDFYYDYADLRLFLKEVRLRARNNKFELKIGDDEVDGVAQEIEDDEEIMNYLKTTKPLEQFVKEDLVEIINYQTRRNKYKKGNFSIDVDELSFGYKCVEIELLVNDSSEVEEAKKKIIKFATDHGIAVEDVPAKRKEYFRIMKPEIYRKLYS